MNSGINFLKPAFGVGVFGVALFFGANITANAQCRDNDRYYGQKNNGYYSQNRCTDKSRQKAEKRQLKHHQRHEREYYGNSREMRLPQKQERRRLKKH